MVNYKKYILLLVHKCLLAQSGLICQWSGLFCNAVAVVVKCVAVFENEEIYALVQ